jgi:hypothetical protein
MKTNLLKQHALAKIPGVGGKPTHKMMRERAIELAMIKGRSAQDLSKADWEQARRDLTEDPDTEPQTPGHVSVADSERWDPVAGSTGYKVHVPSGDDEDDEGRSDTERLVEEGVREAGRDQMRQANRDDENI